MSNASAENQPAALRRHCGRSARVREAVVAATVAELQECGYDRLTVPAAAARAGVHESSIYRRWRSREGLLTEATFAQFAQKISVPDGGSLYEDLLALSVAAGRHLGSQMGRAAMQFALAVHDDETVTREVNALWHQHFQSLRQVFDRATLRGEWPERGDPWPFMQ